MKMRETSRTADKKLLDNNYLQGKTYLVSLFTVVRCILFPKTKICVASATRSQANEVLSKIEDDFMKNYSWGSENLRREILDCSIGANKAVINFKNGSWIKVVTASDNARGHRANVVVIDEFRMVNKDIIDTVITRFLSSSRHPAYLDNPEYEHLEERNKAMYMSSAWYKDHWSFRQAQSYARNLVDDTKKFFVCGIPYQISIKEHLLSREQIEDEMSDSSFDEMKFSINFCASKTYLTFYQRVCIVR